MNSIRAYLEKFIAIEDVDWNFFVSKLKEQVFEKEDDNPIEHDENFFLQR